MFAPVTATGLEPPSLSARPSADGARPGPGAAAAGAGAAAPPGRRLRYLLTGTLQRLTSPHQTAPTSPTSPPGLRSDGHRSQNPRLVEPPLPPPSPSLSSSASPSPASSASPSPSPPPPPAAAAAGLSLPRAPPPARDRSSSPARPSPPAALDRRPGARATAAAAAPSAASAASAAGAGAEPAARPPHRIPRVPVPAAQPPAAAQASASTADNTIHSHSSCPAAAIHSAGRENGQAMQSFIAARHLPLDSPSPSNPPPPAAAAAAVPRRPARLSLPQSSGADPAWNRTSAPSSQLQRQPSGSSPAVPGPNPPAAASRQPPPTMTRTRAATTSSGPSESLPSIRFTAFNDPRSNRPALSFVPVSRTLPSGAEIIRVGRYSERDAPALVPVNAPSAAPVGFKSKVVSRRHCQFWYEAGKWLVKDVGSSSGTFLNHVRLSPPSIESRAFTVNDGDVIQLGIDFKGGEEMIFRAVKMRVELNRGWQNRLNAFNMDTHKRLRSMTQQGNDDAKAYSQDCSICLNAIAPCQCLFVAPCSHTWHYKCVRSLLQSSQFPIFICPNCRAAADLDAEVDDMEDWEKLGDESKEPSSQESVVATDTVHKEAATLEQQTDGTTQHADAQRTSGAAQPVTGTDPTQPQAHQASAPAKATTQPRASQSQQQSYNLRGLASPSTLAVVNDAVGELTIHDSSDQPPQADTPSRRDATVPSAPNTGPPTATSSRSSSLASRRGASYAATSQPLPIAAHRQPPQTTVTGTDAGAGDGDGSTGSTPNATTPAATTGLAGDGPITPRNDAGPWLMDGARAGGVYVRPLPIRGRGGAFGTIGAAMQASNTQQSQGFASAAGRKPQAAQASGSSQAATTDEQVADDI